PKSGCRARRSEKPAAGRPQRAFRGSRRSRRVGRKAAPKVRNLRCEFPPQGSSVRWRKELPNVPKDASARKGPASHVVSKKSRPCPSGGIRPNGYDNLLFGGPDGRLAALQVFGVDLLENLGHGRHGFAYLLFAVVGGDEE